MPIFSNLHKLYLIILCSSDEIEGNKGTDWALLFKNSYTILALQLIYLALHLNIYNRQLIPTVALGVIG